MRLENEENYTRGLGKLLLLWNTQNWKQLISFLACILIKTEYTIGALKLLVVLRVSVSVVYVLDLLLFLKIHWTQICLYKIFPLDIKFFIIIVSKYIEMKENILFIFVLGIFL